MSSATDGEDSSSPEALRAAGRLAEAAKAYRVRGDLAVAEKLYAEMWDFSAAADVARERGDRPAELGHLLAGSDATAAARLLSAIETGPQAELSKAADVLERHRRWVEAASLKERAGALDAARDLYRKGQALLDTARIERALGRLHEAGAVYEQILQHDPDGPDAVRAHQALGQLLLTLDRPDEAARHLQLALERAPGELKASLLGSLVVALDYLGYPTAADDVLVQLRELDPEAPSRAELVARQRERSEGKQRLAGRYEPIRILGAGASGRVFLAKDLVTGRQVATKVIDVGGDKENRASWARYFAETQRIAAVRHPNLVEVLDVNPGLGLVVMEYVTNGTLADRLTTPQGKPMSTATVQQLLLGVLDALAVLHAQGLVHRDLKPANLFMTATGQFKVGDFGSAYLLSEEATQTAGFVGTLAYMSPEQMSGAELDFSTDLYALGAVGFHAITGRLPFIGPDFVAQHLGEQAPRPSSLRPALAAPWDQLFGALLQKHPRSRPRSIDEVRGMVLRLPMLADDVREPRAVPLPADDTPARPRYQLGAHLSDGAGGPITECVDTKLERTVVVETLLAPYLGTEAGMRHLTWLRELARHAGPRVQRIFALSPRGDGAIEAVFEPGPATSEARLSPLARERLRASLEPLWALGVGHGSLSDSIGLDAPDSPVLVVAGRAPSADAAMMDLRFLGP